MRQIYGNPVRNGPESRLVLDFLSNIVAIEGTGLSESIFIEYRLENSIPDVIIVHWDPKIAENWSSQRRLLRAVDYRLVHLLFIEGSLTAEQLDRFFPINLPRMLKRLYSAGLIVEENRAWRLKPLEEIFAVKRILTVEAKLSSSTRVLEQALLNTLFSSESYVLTQSASPMSKSIRVAHERGVGVWSYSDGRLSALVAARELPLPQSHVSWMLNDIAWHYAQGIKDGPRS